MRCIVLVAVSINESENKIDLSYIKNKEPVWFFCFEKSDNKKRPAWRFRQGGRVGGAQRPRLAVFIQKFDEFLLSAEVSSSCLL